MTLREQQSLFAMLIADLITHAYSAGFEVTFGEAYRTAQQAEWNEEHGLGIGHSLHTERLAMDLNLFKDGQLVNTVNGYRPLGDYWKSLHPLARWGGDFRTLVDPSHFSLTRDGIE